MEFLSTYGLFLVKTLTLVIALLIAVGGIIVIVRAGRDEDKNKLEIKKLNEKYEEYADILNAEVLDKKAQKKIAKEKKKQEKAADKKATDKKRIFVLNFNGDIRASAANSLREEVTALLSMATPADEVVIRLESPGGLVSAYGLAASQLQRLRNKRIPLTVAVDKIAASGGYLMACVANKILAAPFAIIGSIGVVAQVPNFHRLLKNKDIDFEQLTAGKFKRTLTLFGENTPEAREKMQGEIEEIHDLFKDFIKQNRKQIDIEKVATGEHWLATRAIDFKLVDELVTSDDYLQQLSKDADIYQIKYTTKKSLLEKFTGTASRLMSEQRNLF